MVHRQPSVVATVARARGAILNPERAGLLTTNQHEWTQIFLNRLEFASIGGYRLAREKCGTAVGLLQAIPDDANVASQRRLRVIAYGEVTEIEKVGRKIAECEAALKAGP